MLSELNNSEIALAVTGCLVVISALVCLDRFLTRQKSAAMNGNFLRRKSAEAMEFGHVEAGLNWETPAADDWLREVRFDLQDARSVNGRFLLPAHDGRFFALNVEEITSSNSHRISVKLLLPQPRPLKLLREAA